MKKTHKHEAGVWIKRAKSNLAIAKSGKTDGDVLYEDLCFDAQQAAEKALKALSVFYGYLFPKSHDIAYLIETLKKYEKKIPKEVLEGKILNVYAVQARYPGDYEPVTETEYKKAVRTSEKIVDWV